MSEMVSAHSWIEAFQEREFGLNEAQPLAASWECEIATNTLRWSRGVFELFGIPHRARLDRDATADMYMPESRAILDRLRADAITTGGSFTFDAQIRRLGGELRWMRLTADVECENGRPVRLYGTKQDITVEVEATIAAEEKCR